jgi:hypothetical protein
LEYLCAYRPAYHRPPVATYELEPWWVKWAAKRRKSLTEGSFVNLGPQGGRN